MTEQEARTALFSRLLAARLADQVTVKEYYGQAAALGRTVGQAKTALMAARFTDKAGRSQRSFTEADEEVVRGALGKYLLFVQNCEREGIPVTIDYDSYCRELIEVARVEAKQPKAEIVEVGPSYTFHQYTSPRSGSE